MDTSVVVEEVSQLDSLLAKIDLALAEIGHKTIVEAPVMVDLLLDIRLVAIGLKDT